MRKLLYIPIKVKLFFAFSFFLVLGAILFFLTQYYNSKKSESEHQLFEISELHVNVLQYLVEQERFFNNEAHQEAFFREGESPGLSGIEKRAGLVEVTMTNLEKSRPDLKNRFFGLREDWIRMRRVFQECRAILLKRGFKDYGMEGKMRKSIHALLDDPVLSQFRSDLLSLRRHEKDYIIRGSDQYVELLRLESAQLEGKIIRYQQQVKIDFSAQLTLLNRFLLYFNEFARLDRYLGRNSSEGLKAELFFHSQKLEISFQHLIAELNTIIAEELQSIHDTYIITLVLLIIVSIISSFALTRILTGRLQRIGRRIEDFVRSNFSKIPDYNPGIMRDEIYQIHLYLSAMEQEIAVRFRDYRESTERKTVEILEKSKRIEFQKQRIEEQRDVLFYQKEVVEVQNKRIIDSIVYAKRIQDYLFPKQKKIQNLLGNYALYFQPKDIVSGDFFWIEKLGSITWVAVVDCTGHGVPGAFMSIIGNTLLNQAVFEKGITSPSEVLNFLNQGVSKKLGQNGSGSEIKDGMDIALVCIHESGNGTFELTFSGAQRPLVVVRNGELMEYKGQRRPIGWVVDHEIQRFDEVKVNLAKGDR
ncbi:MAG: PP2C family protein-serine/threonine phosphatase, partial [Flavobacteriales bacterium]